MSDPGLDPDAPPVEVRGLVNRFGDQVVHNGVDLTVERGEVLGVVGGSGTGKTVLLNSILGLHRPDAGEIRVFGRELSRLKARERAEIEERWGVLFQQGALFSALTVRENVAAPMAEHTTLPRAMADDLAEMKIALVGLGPEALHRRPAELSGGMRKRVGLARALALDPDLLFLDEPTAGLDPIGAAAFDTLIRELATNLGLTVFMITHDLDSLYAVCDRVAVLADGKVVAVAPPRELEQSTHPWIREYFLGPRGRAAARAAGGTR
ncbi:ABC transporter ATP-binding protein [Caulobacter sp. 17J80-11]|uniref:ABC transporter ATP-binding protein n=1 Tax=Caulobacter sp. 17J80-11 TaxID=2763502 RepID=UPI001653693C|nr:ABC transporter ATP-binding protein [Caulobacter sp. 17J80-11]MBC6983464.1 ABC transporter ATP-binding protein [Caulobacter sp. 17J80-11]